MKEAHGWQDVPEQKIIVKTCSPILRTGYKKFYLFPHRFALSSRKKTQREALEDTKTVQSSSVED